MYRCLCFDFNTKLLYFYKSYNITNYIVLILIFHTQGYKIFRMYFEYFSLFCIESNAARRCDSVLRKQKEKRESDNSRFPIFKIYRTAAFPAERKKRWKITWYVLFTRDILVGEADARWKLSLVKKFGRFSPAEKKRARREIIKQSREQRSRFITRHARRNFARARGYNLAGNRRLYLRLRSVDDEWNYTRNINEYLLLYRLKFNPTMRADARAAGVSKYNETCYVVSLVFCIKSGTVRWN